MIVAASSGSGFFFIIIIGFLLLWLIVVRPQRRRQSQQQQMLGDLRVGDEVLTAGGIYGTVSRIDDDQVTVEIAPKTEVRVARRAIAGFRFTPRRALNTSICRLRISMRQVSKERSMSSRLRCVRNGIRRNSGMD